MTIELEKVLDELPSGHRAALRWFAENSGTICGWPDLVGNGARLVTKAKGIYKPEWSEYALSVRQTLSATYPDKEPVVRPNGSWLYAYYQEGDFPENRDHEYTNRALIKCMRDKVPVGVLRQVSQSPVRYQVLGLALIASWDGGYFYLEGFSPRGYASSGPGLSEVEFISIREEQSLYEAGQFDPNSVTDARERAIKAIVQRRGQPTFRRMLLEIYGGRCAITGSEIPEVLEAAHITPYLGPKTNHPSNGLLLRGDLHTLFDLGLLTIDADTMRVVLAPMLRKGSYGDLHGRAVRVPSALENRPSEKALAQHREWCGL